ncbi:MAG: hypothetical protein NNA21_01045 [Nitrospira sp.]|nr:hypothetical protein [Nitrospira sp.]MCP9461815.1 hypothetical protein [Nitrospira sp.]MCP9474328.1 hypothetical protein [Nitrospira sp.]
MIRLSVGAGLLIALLGGCMTWPATPPDQPFFKLDAQESKWLPPLIRKQEAALATCGETASCDRAYFVRALLGLYERREIAENYFLKLIETAPQSQLAASGKAWLQLLREHPAPASISWLEAVAGAPTIAGANVSLAQVSERLVRDLLEGEAMLQQARLSKEESSQLIEMLQRDLADRERRLESLSKKMESASLQALQKQLAERDKKIEDLTTQLEALKRIDQEMREKVRPIRPPSTVAPAPPSDLTP